MRNQAEANLSALIESTEDLIWSVDLDYRLIAFNRAFRKHIEHNFGGRAEIGKRAEDLLPPERAELWHPLFDRVLAHGPFRIELPFSRSQTMELAFNLIVVHGETTGISIFGKDITERNRTEMELRESADFLRETQRIGGLGSYVLDIQSGVWTCSDFLHQLLGIDRTFDHTLDSWLALIHPEDRAMMDDYFANEVVKKRKPFDKEYRLNRADDKEQRWLHALGHVEFGEGGEPLKMRGVIKDITERKLAELHLRESAESLKEAHAIGGLGSYVMELVTTRWISSALMDRIFGIDADYEHTLAGWTALLHPDERAGVNAYFMEEVLGKGRAFDREYRIVRPNDEEERWIHGIGTLEFDSLGHPLKMRGVIQDITGRKRAEMQLRESEERYRCTFEQAPIGIAHTAPDGRFLRCNARFAEIIGYPQNEIPGLSFQQITDTADMPVSLEMLERNSNSDGDRLQWEKRYLRKDGSKVWVKITVSAQRDGYGQILHHIALVEDINALKAAEQRLASSAESQRVSEERYRTVFQTSLDSITISRLDNEKFIDANRAFLDVMGFERDEVIGRTSLEINLWSDARDRDSLLEVLNRTKECRNVEIQFRRTGGEPVWGLLSASVIEIDGVQCVLTITRDISNAKAAEDKIHNLAFYDPLTGLPNRRLLLERLRQAVASTNRSRRMHALLFIDLDNFKTLNDTLGHQTGDKLLQETARRLSTCIRGADTVGRLGGDEFVFMLEDLSENPEDAAAQAKTVGEKILATLSEPCMLEGRECRSSASIGISVFGDRREGFNEILQHADIAMYQAKTAGRNTLRFFAPALQAAVNARAAMEEDLRLGLETGQFVLYYQPQIDRNRLIGAEALIRWNHPQRHFLPPDEFIPLAEETGLILPLGRWVLETACLQIAEWAHNKETADLSIAVNISARQFRQPDFVEQVLGALDRTGASPSKLGLELTESMLVENIEEVIEKMTELKSHGLSFSLDDFGTGYSSLSYLRRLPLDQLKIDRSFIRDILVDQSSAAIAQTIISLSHAMGLPVIAEGVETEEQRKFLTRNGCDAFQGYLFGRPLPLEEFENQWIPSRKFPISVAFPAQSNIATC